MTLRPCIYVSATWGLHDQRWTAALARIGYEARLVRIGYEADSIGSLRSKVETIARPNVPVLAGPLDRVTRELLDVPGRLVGLSWGFDLHEMIDRSWLQRLDALIVDSWATRDIASNAGLSETCITVLPWGVDLSVFTPEGPLLDLSPWSVPIGAPLVLSLRAHEPKYRVADIVDALALLPPQEPAPHLILGHSGTLTEDLVSRVCSLELESRVHFTGTIPEEGLAPLMRAVDCYVTASEVDGSSVTLLQAMACGIAVVASDTPGNLGWVRPDITGRTFPTGDAGALARQIASSLESDNSAMIEEALRLVRQRADWSTNLIHLKRALEGS